MPGCSEFTHRLVTLVAIAALLACGFVTAASAAADDRLSQRRKIAPRYDEIRLRAQARAAVPVLVRFKVDGPDGRSLVQRREAGRLRLRNAMARRNMRPFSELPRLGVAAFVVDTDQLDQLLDSGLVEAAWESKTREPHLQQSNVLINSQVARNAGLDGGGAVVVILDTGIDSDHTTFDDRVVWEACFSTNLNYYGSTNLCPGGGGAPNTQYVQKGIGAAALTKCTDVDCWHGTHVASIAAGSNATYTGVAPAAEIVAMQVFSRFPSEIDCGAGRAPCILSYDHDQLAALEYAAELATTYNIASVNLSLGGGAYTDVCDWDSVLPAAVDALAALDIVVVASSGNSYYDDALGQPACVEKIVSAGSVHDTSGNVSSFSNSAAMLDILAPGKPITAAYPGAAYTTASGTSMSAPHVSGALAIVKAADGSLTHAQMKSLLLTSGVPVLDTRNGLTFPRLDLHLLVQTLLGNVPGDANNDGKLDVADLLLVQQHVVGLITLGAVAEARCDLYPAGSPDGVVDGSDLLRLEQLLRVNE